jgi:4-diphosphocytidyl-2C-methyl-D-erythritol kinase
MENIGPALSDLLVDTQTAVGNLADKKSTDDREFTELKENWEISTNKQNDLNSTYLELKSTVSALNDRFLKDFAAFTPVLSGTAPEQNYLFY